MSNIKAMFEIFEEVEQAKPKAAKIVVLHKYSGKDLKQFLSFVYDPNIKWLVPEGKPPYEPSKDDVNLLRGRIWQDFRLLQHFTSTGPYPNMKQGKRESMFIDLIQTLHPKDAELILYAKDHRDLPYKSVTRALITEAFPLLTEKWGAESKKEKKQD